MPRFLVESHVAAPGAFEETCEQARRAADAGDEICYVRTTFLPGGETVLHLFDAPSSGALDEAGRLVGLRFDRIVETLDDDREENDDDH
jgi:hypothetical protein